MKRAFIVRIRKGWVVEVDGDDQMELKKKCLEGLISLLKDKIEEAIEIYDIEIVPFKMRKRFIG